MPTMEDGNIHNICLKSRMDLGESLNWNNALPITERDNFTSYSFFAFTL